MTKANEACECLLQGDVNGCAHCQEFRKRVDGNIWDTNIDEVIATIKELTSEDSDWTWARNTRCKYIDIHIDMRDGAFTILNRDGRISPAQLKWQYGSKPELSKEKP